MVDTAPRADEPLYISDDTVRALIDEQFPWLADRELGRRYTLEDHFAMRIGDDYGAIFPRVQAHADLYGRVTDLIATPMKAWSFPASAPLARGVAGHGFPWDWVIVKWISSSTVSFVPLRDDAVVPFARALREVHSPAPKGTPQNPRTSIGLPERLERFALLVERVGETVSPENRVLDTATILDRFESLVDEPIDVPATWTHGRIEPRSVSSDQGAFAGLLLWHNFGAGDPAADVGCALNMVPDHVRDQFWAGYGRASVSTRRRAEAFQLYAALRYIEIDDPYLLRMAWERLIELGLAHEA
ncbi:phosphotransferase [Demequina flava]|uniref:phosphotransferase n=1 Tax=Demequina flava TaxID=1095025 RepID=UPI000780E216|nr:phosphotransferase [Demequina flava]